MGGRLYHHCAAVGQVGLYAEDVVVSNLHTAALWVIQMQIPDLSVEKKHSIKTNEPNEDAHMQIHLAAS